MFQPNNYNYCALFLFYTLSDPSLTGLVRSLFQLNTGTVLINDWIGSFAFSLSFLPFNWELSFIPLSRSGTNYQLQ